MIRWLFAFAVALMSPGIATAGLALLLDGTQLAEALKSSQPCCVIDARSEGPRKQNPISFAVAHREGMVVSASSFAIIIADTDQRALEIARALAASNPGRIFAVKGGFATWQQLSGNAEGTTMPRGFTIPSNTCEQGKPLQEFK